MSIIRVNGITKKYGTKIALDNVYLEIDKGQIVGLMGPNGSGKTTLIKLIMGLLKSNQGTIEINGIEPSETTKAHIAYLPDKLVFPSHMKASDLLNFYRDFYKDFDRSKAENMLDDLGISLNQKVKSMSKGTKEKFQLILTMARNADVYLLDEPIAGVDPAARDYILKTIITNYNPEAVVIISTHLISDVESVLDDVIFIKEGHVVLHKNADVLREEEGKSVDKLFREVFKC